MSRHIVYECYGVLRVVAFNYNVCMVPLGRITQFIWWWRWWWWLNSTSLLL